MSSIKFKKAPILLVFGNPPLSLSDINNSGIPLSKGVKTLLSEKGYITHATQPGLGAVTLASYLNQKGFEVDVKDWYLDNFNMEGYSIIGISTASMDIPDLQIVAKKIRTANQDCVIIAGGPLSWSYTPEEVLKRTPEINYLVNNEGEETFIELITAIANQAHLSQIRGISYRENGICLTTMARENIDPHKIVAPDWALIELKNRIPLLPFETMRGCPYNCAFCSEVTYWGKPVRFRRTLDVINEIESNIINFKISSFRISDSCFSSPENRCIEICDAIIERFINNGVRLQWSSFVRITNISEKLVSKMQEAGCVALDIGMESGDETILQTMKKNYSRKNIIDRVTYAKKTGLLTHCNVIVGFPGETKNTIKNTINILNEAQPDSYHCMLLYVAPNADLFRNKNKYGINGERLSWQHATMNSQEALEIMPYIVTSVINSCLFVSGEISAMMLISCGFQIDEVRTFFKNVSLNIIGEKEKEMAKTALLRKKGI